MNTTKNRSKIQGGFYFGISGTKPILHLLMHSLPLTYNDHTLFHMLRHFESIHEPAQLCLLERGYKPAAINDALVLPGSRFHTSFAQDLKKLEQQMQLGIKQTVHSNTGYQHWKISFDKLQFPNGIGTLGVVHLAELENFGACNLMQKINRGILMQHASVDVLPNSWEMSVVVKQQKNYYLLITAFPGLPSMPLPKPHLETEFNRDCRLYWNSHVFLETDKKLINTLNI